VGDLKKWHCSGGLSTNGVKYTRGRRKVARTSRYPKHRLRALQEASKGKFLTPKEDIHLRKGLVQPPTGWEPREIEASEKKNRVITSSLIKPSEINRLAKKKLRFLVRKPRIKGEKVKKNLFKKRRKETRLSAKLIEGTTNEKRTTLKNRSKIRTDEIKEKFGNHRGKIINEPAKIRGKPPSSGTRMGKFPRTFLERGAFWGETITLKQREI